MSDQEKYWRKYFESRFASANLNTVRKLDYSNEAVRQQTYAWMLEGCGPVNEHSVLDVGCGNGEFAVICHCLGASVTGIDINRVTIGRLKSDHPAIKWGVIRVGDTEFSQRSLGHFQHVFCAEVLQYVAIRQAVPWLWNLVAPGGRLCLVVPNKNCPIIKKVERRFPGSYLIKWRAATEALTEKDLASLQE